MQGKPERSTSDTSKPRKFEPYEAEEGEEFSADEAVVEIDGEKPEGDVDVLAQAVEAQLLRLRDLVQHGAHQIS